MYTVRPCYQRITVLASRSEPGVQVTTDLINGFFKKKILFQRFYWIPS